jgi:hypothetical protein
MDRGKMLESITMMVLLTHNDKDIEDLKGFSNKELVTILTELRQEND